MVALLTFGLVLVATLKEAYLHGELIVDNKN